MKSTITVKVEETMSRTGRIKCVSRTRKPVMGSATLGMCALAMQLSLAKGQPIRDPSDVSGLAIWQDAGSLSRSNSNGAKVSWWPSSGGMTAGAAQPNALLQPTFHNGVLGGRPVVTFGGDASNQSLRVMASTTNQATYGDLAIGPAGITYFAVIRVTQSTVGVLFGDDNAICDFPVSTSQVSLGRHDGHYFSGRVTVPGDYTVFLRLAGTFSNINPSAPNLTTLYTNGVPSPTTSDINSALPIADLGLNIGADITDNTSRPHFGGDLAEMIIYNRMLSTNELRQVDAYLQNKYFSSLSIQISQVRLCWGSLSNRLYQVQYQSALTSNNWMNLGAPITGSGATDCATDSVTDERRVYRVLLLP